MNTKKRDKAVAKKLSSGSSGAVSTILLVLGIVLIVVIIIIFVVVRLNASRTATTSSSQTKNTTTTGTTATEPEKPVYDGTIGDVKFIFQSAQDMGNTLVSKYTYGQSLHTTEKYIKVTIGAQNKGKVNTPASAWQIGDIVDSDGRDFVSIDSQAYSFLPNPNLCGTLLKPEFDPTPCVRYYEVSKISKGLKIKVSALTANGKSQTALLDLLVTQ